MIYSAILISINNIGGTDVTLQENNGVGTVNQLLATVGNEKLIIDSVDFYSDKTTQVQQPIEFIKRGINGNQKNVVRIPNLDRYQLNNTIKGVKAKKFPIDEDTYINYIIEGNTFVRITLNINKEARKLLSYTKLLDRAIEKDGILNTVDDEPFHNVAGPVKRDPNYAGFAITLLSLAIIVFAIGDGPAIYRYGR